MSKTPTRKRDEEVLEFLRLRACGLSLRQVARAVGLPSVKAGQIATAVERVKLADVKECSFWGDAPREVAECYK